MRVTITDIYEASYLNCSGFQIAEMWVDQGRLRETVCFAFEGGNELENRQREYHIGRAQVNLTDFLRSMQKLRRIMFGILKKQRVPEKPAAMTPH